MTTNVSIILKPVIDLQIKLIRNGFFLMETSTVNASNH